MGVTGRTGAGALSALVALVGLYFAANAIDAGIYYSGLLIFMTMLVYIFYLVKRQIDEGQANDRLSGSQ